MSDNYTKDEEILTETANRFVLFPIKYQKIWEMYKKAEAAFWTAEEIDLSKDWSDWERLSENERFFIKQVLAFFAGSDGIVNENLSVRFMHDVKPQEAKSFYGFQITMENIHCVTGDTQIYTRNGYIAIKKLEDKQVEVWNGEVFAPVKVCKTGTAVPVFRVLLSNGMSLDCTSKHKWVIKGETKRVFTQDLKIGMTVEPFKFPEYHAMTDLDMFSNPYEHGFMAFSTASNKDYIPTMFNCRGRYDVPINYSITTKTRWLSGAISQAIITPANIEESITFPSNNQILLQHLQLLLTTLGIHSTRAQDKVTINRHFAYKLSQFTNINLPDLTPIYEMSDFVNTIISVEPLAKAADTYCFEEPLRNMGVFNGILTGQSETYSILIDTYIKDSQEKHHLLNAINTIPCIRKKADWAIHWIEDKDAPFAMRLVAFACVEGIFFSGAFCAIFWLKERGVMPGLCLSNEFISRDEALHTEFAVLLYSMLRNKLPQETVHKMVGEAVEIEDEFITDSIPCRMLGMNSDLMTQYIKFVADRLLVQLGYDKMYSVMNPFDFMDRINLEHKANFFEDRNSQYSLANVGNTEKHAAFEFNDETDF